MEEEGGMNGLGETGEVEKKGGVGRLEEGGVEEDRVKVVVDGLAGLGGLEEIRELEDGGGIGRL